MSLLETLENQGASWAFRKFAANSILHWKTSLGGVVTLLTSAAGLIKYLTDAASTGQLDLNTLMTYLGGVSAGIGLLAAKDAGQHDIAVHCIPRATVVN